MQALKRHAEIRRRRLVPGLVAVLLVSGGASLSITHPAAAAKAEPIDHRLVASQKRLPKDVYRNVGRAAMTKTAYRRLWDRFRLRGDRPRVNLDRRIVLFVGTGESGSCPLRFESLRFNDERKTFKLRAPARGGPVCTDDFTPRTFVIAVDRSDLPKGDLRARVNNYKRFELRRAR